MMLKQFPKPDWRRILIFIVIYAVLIFYILPIETIKTNCGFITRRGLPLNYFFSKGGTCEKNGIVYLVGFETHFYLLNFVLDFFILGLVSYFFAIFLIWCYDKLKKKE